MIKGYVVYTEIRKGSYSERWYYGTYDDLNKANDVAYELGHGYEDEFDIYHCVCDASQAVKFGIRNLPDCFHSEV